MRPKRVEAPVLLLNGTWERCVIADYRTFQHRDVAFPILVFWYQPPYGDFATLCGPGDLVTTQVLAGMSRRVAYRAEKHWFVWDRTTVERYTVAYDAGRKLGKPLVALLEDLGYDVPAGYGEAGYIAPHGNLPYQTNLSLGKPNLPAAIEVKVAESCDIPEAGRDMAGGEQHAARG